MRTRHVAFGSMVLGMLALVVVVVTGGSAGTSTYDFQVLGPAAVTTGQPSLVFAKFTPSKSSGSATHTVITFTFPAGSITGTPTASGCDAPSVDGAGTTTISCTVGTVQGGVTVKRFVQYTAGSTTGDPQIAATVSFDQGTGGNGKGGGAVNGVPVFAPTTFVDGTSTDGRCVAGGSSSATSPVSNTVEQSTALTFGDAQAGLSLPCAWGTVGVQDGQRGPDGAPKLSTVEGPTYGGPAQLTLTFSSLPVPLKKYVLQENESFDPAHPAQGWFVVRPCPTPTTLPAGADACLIGYDTGKPIVAHLLYAGTGGDPWFN